MNPLIVEEGLKYYEVVCNGLDFEDVFPDAGEIEIIRFFYEKGVTPNIGALVVGNQSMDNFNYPFLDYQHYLHGLIDFAPNNDIKVFKKGEDFKYLQYKNTNNSNVEIKYNLIEKIFIYIK